MSQIVNQLSDGTFEMNTVVVFSCGCANVVPEARTKLRLAGVADIPFLMTNTNPKIKKYIRQIGLDMLVPSLGRSTHSVLYNPFTGKYVDLLKAPKTSQVFENIYKVAVGK